jgi:hypothetical protein
MSFITIEFPLDEFHSIHFMLEQFQQRLEGTESRWIFDFVYSLKVIDSNAIICWGFVHYLFSYLIFGPNIKISFFISISEFFS